MVEKSKKCSSSQSNTCNLILEDLLRRLDDESKVRAENSKKLDERLDAIEKEIAGVKKVISFITWIFKIVPVVISIFAVFGKYLHLSTLWQLIPKGRGDRSAVNLYKKQ